MTPKDPAYEARVRAIWSAPFVAHLGLELVRVAPGLVESAVMPRDEHLQQDGVVHAGVIATLADHSAGAAAGSLIAAHEIILTSELTLHLLRPARGRLTCSAKVLKPGRLLSVVEAEVRGADGALFAKLISTLVVAERVGGS